MNTPAVTTAAAPTFTYRIPGPNGDMITLHKRGRETLSRFGLEYLPMESPELISKEEHDGMSVDLIRVYRAWAETATKEDALNNPQRVRTYHPALAACPRVGLMTSYAGENHWVVMAAPFSTLRVCEMEVHFIPRLPFVTSPPGFDGPRDPLRIGFIDPAKPLHDCHIRVIKSAYPTSVGARVLRTGQMAILFSSKSDVKSVLSKPLDHPSLIGDLRICLDVCDAVPSSATAIVPGNMGGKAPPYQTVDCSLGVKLQLDRATYITTVTHAWIPLYKSPDNIVLRAFVSAYFSVKEKLSKTLVIQRASTILAKAKRITFSTNLESDGHDTPFGKEVWIPHSDVKVGKIMRCFDPDYPLALTRPFPIGLQHDLCLISCDNDTDLLPMYSPHGLPRITGWGDVDSLKGNENVYTCSSVFNNGDIKGKTMIGRTVSKVAHEAIIIGADYFWHQETVSRAVIWRTEFDTTYSGSALCLGKQTDATSQVLVFQNYEAPLRASFLEQNERKQKLDLAGCTYKGGFVLPEIVRHSEIIMDVI